MLVSCLRYASAGAMSLALAACVGGAGVDREADREAAMNYRGFRAARVSVHLPADGARSAAAINRDNYFSRLENHVNVPVNVDTRMDNYTFFTTFANSKRIIKVTRGGQVILSETIPSVFYMGDLQAATVDIGGREYLMLAANTRSSTNRRWFGMYGADGERLYTASFARPIAQVKPNGDGVSLFFHHDDSMRIRIQ
jgi:hypothetical protein